MTGLAQFCQRHQLTVRQLSAICGGTKGPRGGVSHPTAHRLLHRQLNQAYLEKIEPIVIASLRAFLRSKGLSEEQARIEVPDSEFLAPLPQFTQEIIVPADCFANYVFKDQTGKVLSVSVFKQTAHRA